MVSEMFWKKKKGLDSRNQAPRTLSGVGEILSSG